MSDGVILRAATPEDVQEMYHISVLAHQAGYASFIPLDRRADFDKRYTVNEKNFTKYKVLMMSRMTNPEWHIWVAEIDGVIVGYTLGHLVNNELLVKKGLFVHPKYQGFGIGKALFEKSLELIDKGEIRLVVIENNLRAKTMYEKHGFVASGEDVKAFYSSPQVAMSLRKN